MRILSVVLFGGSLSLVTWIASASADIEKPAPYTSCVPALRALAPFSAASYMPADDSVNGVRLPRNYFTLYRGVDRASNQVTLPMLLRGVFGDRTPTFGSFVHTDAYRALVQHRYSDPNGVFSMYHLESIVREALDCKASYTDSEAYWTAAKISDYLFTQAAQQSYFKDSYFRYRESGFTTYGDRGTAWVYNGLHPRTSNRYGDTVFVFTDPKKRGVDLNFFNYKDNREWAYHTADVGEYVMPGYADPEGYVGLWYNDGPDHRAAAFLEARDRKITYGFHRVDLKDGKKAVYVYEGAGAMCAILDSDLVLKPCYDPFQWIATWGYASVRDSRQAVFSQPVPDRAGNPLPIAGIILDCAKGKPCEVPDEIKNRNFPISQLHLTRSEIGQIEKLGLTYKLLRHRNGGMEILSARYGDTDVTTYTADFCEGQKRRCEYKVSKRYIPAPTGASSDFEVQYRCKPGDAIQTAIVPSPAEDEIITLDCH